MTDRQTALLTAALQMAEQGHPVLPCGPGTSRDDKGSKLPGNPVCYDPQTGEKYPRGKGGLKKATCDPDTIKSWFSGGIEYNIGVVPGPDTIVLDLDVNPPKKDGTATISALEEELGPLPKSWIAVTPTGGYHLWFLAPGHGLTSKKNLFKDDPRFSPDSGLDIRSAGGYVLIPPSKRPALEGAPLYQWTDCNPDTMPQPALLPLPWLQKLREDAAKDKKGKSTAATKKGTPDAFTAGHFPIYDPAVYTDALFSIVPPKDRDDWLHLLMAAKAAGVSAGDADRWSAQDPEAYIAKDFQDTWESIDPQGGIGPGTLIAEAKKQGWNPPRLEPGGRGGLPPTGTLDIFPRSDLSEGTLFSHVYEDKVRYSNETNWLVYDGCKWSPAPLAAMGLMKQLIRDQLEEAGEKVETANKAVLELQKQNAGIPQDALKASPEWKEAQDALKKAKEYFNWAVKQHSAGRITAALEMAKSDCAISTEALDKDPFLLNTPSGTVNLKTGELKPSSYSDYCTHCCAVAPSNEGAGQWKEFLRDITCGDEDLEAFLQVIAGSFLIGRVMEEKLFIAQGAGANGKSTFFGTLQNVLGSYACSLSPEILSNGYRGNRLPELALLKGKRLAIAAESNEMTIDSATVKRLASTDSIYAELKYQNGFTFTPSHSVVLFTNVLPVARDIDHGFWRRIVIIPFHATFSGNTAKKNYAATLTKECGGAALAWCIEGARSFCEHNFTIEEPPCVLQETEDYRQANNWVSEFLEDCCTVAPSLEVGAAALYSVYGQWANGKGEKPKPQRYFSKDLISAGFDRVKRKSGKVYCGLALVGAGTF